MIKVSRNGMRFINAGIFALLIAAFGMGLVSSNHPGSTPTAQKSKASLKTSKVDKARA